MFLFDETSLIFDNLFTNVYFIIFLSRFCGNIASRFFVVHPMMGYGRSCCCFRRLPLVHLTDRYCCNLGDILDACLYGLGQGPTRPHVFINIVFVVLKLLLVFYSIVCGRSIVHHRRFYRYMCVQMFRKVYNWVSKAVIGCFCAALYLSHWEAIPITDEIRTVSYGSSYSRKPSKSIL